MFVTLHILKSMPLGLINRGADGLAKRGTFGGETRQRVSPQCFKAHLRENEAIRSIAERIGLGMSVRSARLEREIVPILRAAEIDEHAAEEYAKAALDLLFRGEEDKAEAKPKGKPKKSAETGEEGDVVEMATGEPAAKEKKDKRQILCLGRPEIEAIAALALTAHKEGMAATALRGGKSPPTSVKEALAAIKALKAHAGFDGALFGRMATSSVVSQVDGAVAVSNWLTTHPIQATTDFFSAQDQLLRDDEAGTAHIGTRELAAGVFYGNVVIDVARLRMNLGPVDEHDVQAVIDAIVEAVLTTDPSAMRGNTGAAGEVGEAVAEIGPSLGLSAMLAFERGDAYTMSEARTRLLEHLQGRQQHLMPRQRPARTVVLKDQPSYEAFCAAVLIGAIPNAESRAA